ncbi:Protein of unknown function (DUF1645 [Striga hermonthica]|uniref:Calmodulin-binding protein n=1 Tax=Striga hermonthica TaxID=68872 RepID=A0A9N7NF21_STRHE|nr:Protein of unknown function (DUF1645 [Striga hermonthica]
MEVEVIIPTPASADFNFDSSSTSPFISAPSSPSFYCRSSAASAAAASAVPFGWEEKPGVPKSTAPSSAASSTYGDADDGLDAAGEFAFDFSGHLLREPLPADELFDGGRIRPLKPPPGLQRDPPETPPPRSPRSPGKFIREALSPKNRSRDFDPFAAAMEQTRWDGDGRQKSGERKKGRGKKISRSLSPFRVSDMLFEPDPTNEPDKGPATGFSSFWHRRWRIKDLLLFRSASEGRAAGPGLLGRPRRDDAIAKDSSFGSGSSRRRAGPGVSAHELHYTANRQLSEEMRRRTFLPYKQGLLGCLGFHPPAHDLYPAQPEKTTG